MLTLQPAYITYVYTIHKGINVRAPGGSFICPNTKRLWRLTAEQAVALQKPSAATQPLPSTLKRLSADGVQRTLKHKLLHID